MRCKTLRDLFMSDLCPLGELVLGCRVFPVVAVGGFCGKD